MTASNSDHKITSPHPRYLQSSYQQPSREPSHTGYVYTAPGDPQNAACISLRADAAARATILRSPTLGAEIDDTKQGDVNIAFDLVDLQRARLVEQAASASCRNITAQHSLQWHLLQSPEKLTHAGLKAKADRTDKRRPRLRAIARNIDRHLTAGNLTITEATLLRVQISGTLAEGDKARAEASRRVPFFVGLQQQVSTLAQTILQSSRDLDNVRRRMRTAEATSIRLNGGATKGGQASGGASGQSELEPRRSVSGGQGVEYYGSIKLTLRLGALHPNRRYHEDIAQDARERAMSEPGGQFWQAALISTSHRKALRGLRAASTELDTALKRVRNARGTLERANGLDYINALLTTRLRESRILIAIAGVRASIKEILHSALELDDLRP